MKYIGQMLFALTVLPVVLMAQPMVVLSEQKTDSGAGEKLVVMLEIKSVRNLDTYLVSVRYDHENLRLVDAALDAPLIGIRNVLRSKERTLLPVIKKEQGFISIAATLSGEKPLESSENGVIGILAFEIVNSPWEKIALENVELLDSKGEKIECMIASY